MSDGFIYSAPAYHKLCLHVAFELGNSTWKLACSNGRKVRQVTVTSRDLEQVQGALLTAQAHFGMAEGAAVVSFYEAGRDGFWLHWYLQGRGIDNVEFRIIVNIMSIQLIKNSIRSLLLANSEPCSKNFISTLAKVVSASCPTGVEVMCISGILPMALRLCADMVFLQTMVRKGCLVFRHRSFSLTIARDTELFPFLPETSLFSRCVGTKPEKFCYPDEQK
jgi:hypothetical protein